MIGLNKFLIGAVSVALVVFAILGLFLSSMFASMIDGGGALASLMGILPMILFGLSILGFWSIIKNNRPGQYTFGIFILSAWYVGTIFGAIIIALLLLTREEKQLAI